MAALMVVMAGRVLAAPGGNGHGIGHCTGGNYAANTDNGNLTATGGGQLNNRHLGCQISC
jgi:hypothetical protein